MRLIKCHVENFGALSGFNTDFTDGFCVIKEHNGFGKTTLAAFVKAMFYGLPVTRKADINENERAKYDPWQGGNYGGSLDFECEKGKFRIERFFGNKAKDDSFKLFDLTTGAESTLFTENIGNELFSIDAESFEKSIFLPQQKLGLQMNASINAKLTGLVEDNDDIGNFDTAMAQLDKQQKARGLKGRLDAVNKEISEIERDIVDKKLSASVLSMLLKQREQYKLQENTLEKRLEVLRREITIASDLAAAIKDNERREELLKEIEKSNSLVDAILKKYKQIPNETEVLQISQVITEQSAVVSGLSVLDENTHQEQRLKELEDYFAKGLPTEEQLSECKENLKKHETAVIKSDALVNQIKELPIKNDYKKGNFASKLVFVLALILGVLGIITLFANVILGVALLGAGIVFAGIAGFLMLKKMITSSVSLTFDNTKKINEEYAQVLKDAEYFKEKVLSFTQKYGDDEPNKVLEKILENFSEYKALVTAVDHKKQRVEAQNLSLAELNEKISDFFKKYVGNTPQNLVEAVNLVREDIKTLTAENKKIGEYQQKLSAIPEFQKVEDVQLIDRELLLKEETECGEKLDTVRRELTSLQSRITAAEHSADILQDLLGQLEEKNEQKAELTSNLEIVQLTEQFLKDARDGLSSRYMTVLKSGFEKYTSEICKGSIGEFLLDNSLTLGISRQGGVHKSDCFSEGYRDMLDICMRLALSDALYDGEKPMLILDDPFVNLDDERVTNALQMLQKLAQNRQIIYLTCHNSRLPAY